MTDLFFYKIYYINLDSDGWFASTEDVDANFTVLNEQGFDPRAVHFSHMEGKLVSAPRSWISNLVDSLFKRALCRYDQRWAGAKAQAIYQVLRQRVKLNQSGQTVCLPESLFQYLGAHLYYQSPFYTWWEESFSAIQLEPSGSDWQWDFPPVTARIPAGAQLSVAIEARCEKVARYLIGKGAPIDLGYPVASFRSYPPLRLALIRGLPAIALELVKKGADLVTNEDSFYETLDQLVDRKSREWGEKEGNPYPKIQEEIERVRGLAIKG